MRRTIPLLALGSLLMLAGLGVAQADPPPGHQGRAPGHRRDHDRPPGPLSSHRPPPFASGHPFRHPGPHWGTGSEPAQPGQTQPEQAQREQAQARRERVEAHLKKLAGDRVTRREAEEKRLKKKWGPLPPQPEARAELRLHAWRVARLKAIRQIASDEGKTEQVTRVDALLAKEEARHDRRMQALGKTEGTAKPGVSAPPVTAAGAAQPSPHRRPLPGAPNPGVKP